MQRAAQLINKGRTQTPTLSQSRDTSAARSHWLRSNLRREVGATRSRNRSTATPNGGRLVLGVQAHPQRRAVLHATFVTSCTTAGCMRSTYQPRQKIGNPARANLVLLICNLPETHHPNSAQLHITQTNPLQNNSLRESYHNSYDE